MSRQVNSGLPFNVNTRVQYSSWLTYRTSSAKANTPTAKGAAALVPPWDDEQDLGPTSVETYVNKLSVAMRRSLGLPETHNMFSRTRTISDDHVRGTSL